MLHIPSGENALFETWRQSVWDFLINSKINIPKDKESKNTDYFLLPFIHQNPGLEKKNKNKNFKKFCFFVLNNIVSFFLEKSFREKRAHV